MSDPIVRAVVRAPDGDIVAVERSVRASAPHPDSDPWDLPVRLTPEVERWIRTYTGPARSDFEVRLQRMSRFDDLIRRQLRERGMPEDLIFVPLVESGFRPLALSSARASGMWQFMEGTAREHGLRVDAWVDERLDPIRSTDAALDFLETLHARFRSWYLAAAAYNAGPGRVERALRRHGGRPLHGVRIDSEAGFWHIAEHLPTETRQHVPRLIAAAVVGSAPEYFGLEPAPPEPLAFDRVFVPGLTRIEDVASAAGVQPDELRRLNPHLVRGTTPPDVLYPVRVPRGAREPTLASLPTTPAAPGEAVLAAE